MLEDAHEMRGGPSTPHELVIASLDEALSVHPLYRKRLLDMFREDAANAGSNSSFKTWLLRVVSNAALDMGRQRGRRVALNLGAAEANDGDDPSLLVPGDPAGRLERADLRRQLNQALATLSEAQRRTFVLHAEAGLSYREVADVMGISIGTVMSRLYYARQKLRAYLEQQAQL